jgi:hypothetical protein
MHSLTLVLEGGEWSASHLGHFTPGERALGTHWIGGWVGPRAILDVVVKRKGAFSMKSKSRIIKMKYLNHKVGYKYN